jgi:vacuolar-type H+-ATPase subunit E/Vma4
MGLIDQLNLGTAEAADTLRDMFAVLTKVDGTFETAFDEIDSVHEAWEALSNTIENVVEEITENITEHQESTHVLSGSIVTALAGMGSVFTMFQQEFQELETDLGSMEFEAVDSGLEDFRRSTQEIVESCEAVGQLLDSDGQDLRTKLEEILQSGSDTKTILVSNATGMANDYISSLQTGFVEATSAIGQELKEQGLTSMSDFQSHLSGEVKDALTSGMEELENTLGEAYGNFKDNLETKAGELQDKLGEVAGDLVDDFREEAGEQIEQFLKDAMEDAVEDFAKAAGEDFAMMGVGTQVTGALSPILPELMVAEKILPAFNAALSAMKFW